MHDLDRRPECGDPGQQLPAFALQLLDVLLAGGELLAEFRRIAGEQDAVPVFVERSGARIEIRVRP